MSQTQLESVVTGYYANLAAMNLEGLLENFAENAVIYDPVGKPAMNVQQDFPKFVELISKFYQKFEISPEQVFPVENQAAVKWTMQVTAKNGKTVTAEGIGIFKFNQAGKIQQIESYWDEAAMKAKLMG